MVQREVATLKMSLVDILLRASEMQRLSQRSLLVVHVREHPVAVDVAIINHPKTLRG
jgi:hypothetical protein